MKKLWRFLTIYDKILIVILILGSIVFIISPLASFLIAGSDRGAEKVVVIQGNNGFLQRLPLDDSYRVEPILIKVPGPLGNSIVEAHNGQVRLKEAPPDDPEKICEKTGWIDQVGPMIICVPNRVSIWIEAKESDLDGVSW